MTRVSVPMEAAIPSSARVPPGRPPRLAPRTRATPGEEEQCDRSNAGHDGVDRRHPDQQYGGDASGNHRARGKLRPKPMQIGF